MSDVCSCRNVNEVWLLCRSAAHVPDLSNDAKVEIDPAVLSVGTELRGPYGQEL